VCIYDSPLFNVNGRVAALSYLMIRRRFYRFYILVIITVITLHGVYIYIFMRVYCIIYIKM
jgi:hypothetical protein